MPKILGTSVVGWPRDNGGYWLEEDRVYMSEIIAFDIVTPGINDITMWCFAGPWQTQKKVLGLRGRAAAVGI